MDFANPKRFAGITMQGLSGMGSIFYKTKLCSRFRSGNCPYNTNCNFAHGMEELCKPPPGWEDFVTTSQQELPATSSAVGGGSSTEAQVRFHKTRPCKKYFGEGNCPYGDKCNFRHDEQSVPRAVREAREAAVAANTNHITNNSNNPSDVVANSPRANGPGGSTASAGSGPPSARPSSWKTKLCNKWETTGHCPFGDKCHFAHGSDGKWRSFDPWIIVVILLGAYILCFFLCRVAKSRGCKCFCCFGDNVTRLVAAATRCS